MKKQVDKLQGARDRVQHSIDAAIRDAEEIEADVKMWLENVDMIMGKVKEVLEDEENAKMRSFNGACLNLKLRHQQSKKAKQMVQDIDEVLKSGSFDKVSFRPPPQATMTTYKDYMTIKSRMSIVEQLMDALGDANINVIGVWGMPGVGKTTFVREVAKQVKEKKLFYEVAIAEVTQSLDLKRIQQELAEVLGLKFDPEETVRGRAIRLRTRLSKHKVLVILDDIWDKLDLEEVGIPSEGCKVVVTSRNQDTLSCEMGTQKDFELNVLSNEEAWSLFEMIAGESVKDPNLRSTATEVAKECAGLPIALVTVSKALKKKGLCEWKDALQLLRRPAPEDRTKMQSTIYSSIELSFNHLESQEQQIFLLCSQMGYSIVYLDLLKYSYGLCLFHGINTLEEARNRLYRLVRTLKDSCLLLDCPCCEHFHMHDVVRYVAILIASERHNMFRIGNGGKVKEWPDVDALKRCTTFSISDEDVHELPDEMECPELKFFHVKGGNHSLQIADTFFKGMGKLKVLDLTKMKLPSLPTSLHLLRNLQTLCLDYCQLGDIAVIGELKNLEILSLLGSELSHLPREIGLLTSIRLLDLSHCSKLEVIPPNVLSRLVQLEALYMGDSFVKWGNGGLNIDRTNASLTELKHLSHLITLEIHIRDASILPKDPFFEKLERYRIFVGDVWDWSDKCETSRELRLKLSTTLQFEGGIKMLLNGIEHLCLDELEGVKSILYELDREGFQQLRHLHVQNNAKIKHIINSRVLAATEIVFPVLEKFSVKNMINLEEICHGKLPPTTFCNLRIVKVENCDPLKFVFTSSIAKGLSQLEELEIRECSTMGAVVIKEEGDIEDGDMILFPQLRRLALQRLPKLMSFLNTQSSFITDAGEIIHEGRLDFHMPVLHEQVVFPNLDSLELSLPDMEEIQRSHHWARSSCKSTNIQAAKRFQNLSLLEVQGSGSLKYLLSSSTARFMMNVKHLHIIECKVMEEILHIDEEEILSEALFPRLECLVLKDLPILKRFCIDSNVEFPLLKNFIINNCPKLKTFAFRHASSNMEVHKGLVEINSEDNRYTTSQSHINESIVLANLESLEQPLIDLEEKQQSQHWARSFCKITNMQTSIRFQNLLYLGVWGSDSFKYLLSSSIARAMVQVKYLHIVNCKAMEEILFIEDLGDEEEEEEEIIPKMLFPRLEVLILRDLPILKRFCIGSNIEFPSMKRLRIEHCPKLKTFISKPSNSDTMMTVYKEIKEINTEEIPRTAAIQPLFSEEVAFPNLEDLKISYVDDLKIIWHNQFSPYSSCKLKTMEVEFCENLMNIFQSDMLTRFQSLETLTITDCGSLQEVFQLQEKNAKETHDVTVIPLKELRLDRVPKLKSVWNKDPQGIFNFPNLNLDSTGLRSYWSDSVPSD
ncbi:probable disease resistance protein At4g27220 isoform X2 [Quercus suber]